MWSSVVWQESSSVFPLSALADDVIGVEFHLALLRCWNSKPLTLTRIYTLPSFPALFRPLSFSVRSRKTRNAFSMCALGESKGNHNKRAEICDGFLETKGHNPSPAHSGLNTVWRTTFEERNALIWDDPQEKRSRILLCVRETYGRVLIRSGSCRNGRHSITTLQIYRV